MILTSASDTSLWPMPGATLAVMVTWRCRARRLICDGPVVGTSFTTDESGTVLPVLVCTVMTRDSREVRAVLGVGAGADVVVVAALFVGRDLEPADQELERVGHVGHVDAQVARALAVDLDVHLGVADDEVRVDVDRAPRPCRKRSRILLV